MLIAIRVDGSGTIGLGHVHRCLALASAIQRLGGRVAFLTKVYDGVGIERLLSSEATVIRVDDRLDEIDDCEFTSDTAYRLGASLLYVDHYAFGPRAEDRWMSEKRFRVAIADDEAERSDFRCDLLVNQNVGVTGDYYLDSTAEKLLGPRYILLRDSVRAGSPRLKTLPRAETLLITLGGADSPYSTVVLEAAVRCSFRRILLVVGSQSQSNLNLDDRSIDPRVEIIVAPSKLVSLMEQSDLAVTAGGTTTYECAYLGLPNVILQTARNQRRIALGMDRYGCSKFLGEAPAVDSERITESLSSLAGDETCRREMSIRGRALLDGRGADRVAGAMASLLGESNAYSAVRQ